jgi:hypothetical protein
MSTLALNRRFLARAGVSVLLLLTACSDDAVTPIDETTDDPTETQSSVDSTSSSGAVDTTMGPGPMMTSTTAADSEDDTQGTTVGPVSSSSEEGGSTGPIPGVCGNNIIEDEEVCDLAQVNGETCESMGYEGGQLGCLLTCDDYNLLGCFICGNEVIDIAEDCEGEVPHDVTCESMGFQDGFISCGDDCLYDISECSICGDGIQSGFEQCDGIDFGGETCQSAGFAGGNLACNLVQCSLVYTGCFGGQYVEDFEASATIPAEIDLSASAPWLIDEVMPINGARSARSGNMPAGGITNMTIEVSFPAAGNVTFYHREDTAAGFDFLRFYLNGVLQQSWTGNLAPAQHIAPVPAGDHTLQWRFERAGFVNGGQNAVWVDDIVLEGGVPL